MTPADFTLADDELAIYKGARWAHTLTYTETVGGAAMDLTSYLPFVMTIDHATRETLLLNVTVDATDAATGIILVSLTAAQTLTLNRGQVRLGMRDAANNPWGEGVIPVLKFTPTPA